MARDPAKRGDIGFDEALARYSNIVTTTNLPYIEMQSLSTLNQKGEIFFNYLLKSNLLKNLKLRFLALMD